MLRSCGCWFGGNANSSPGLWENVFLCASASVCVCFLCVLRLSADNHETQMTRQRLSLCVCFNNNDDIVGDVVAAFTFGGIICCAPHMAKRFVCAMCSIFDVTCTMRHRAKTYTRIHMDAVITYAL